LKIAEGKFQIAAKLFWAFLRAQRSKRMKKDNLRNQIARRLRSAL